MSSPSHHLFCSYSRLDNRPVNGSAEGWVTAFCRQLEARHLASTGKQLRIFFDQEEIDELTDWRARLGQGLRTSRLFLAFLSPNYIRSKNCRWEWLEYLRREHTAARGDDGIASVYFVTVPIMPAAKTDAPEAMAALEEEFRADQDIARWLDEIQADLRRRNLYLDTTAAGRHPRAAFDLRSWFERGPEVLAEIAAAETLAKLRQRPASDEHDLLTLAERLERLDATIAGRLDRCLLADLAPGNLGRSYLHFVGRHRELVELHRALTTERTGLLTAAHGLGGQGKTALAVQYAFAYAEFYAAGGRWIIPAEGKKTLAEALLPLASDPELAWPIPEDIRADPAAALRWLLVQLRRFTEGNAALLREKLAASPDLRSAAVPDFASRALIILDNVDHPELLHPDQLALLPEKEWLEIIVTTRLDPAEFHADGRALHAIPIDSLPIPDALALLRDFQPGQRFATDAEESAARDLAVALGGYTLAVELAGAYLAAHPEIGFAGFLRRLDQDGCVLPADAIAAEIPIAHRKELRENQLGYILDATLSRLDPPARALMDHAALMAPDHLLMDWLKEIVALPPAAPGHPDLFRELWRLLSGLRLLTPAIEAEGEATADRHAVPRLARIHRVVADHLIARLSPEAREATAAACVAFLMKNATTFQNSWRQDVSVQWLLRPLAENALHLFRHRPGSRELASACGVAAQAEMRLGQLARTEQLLESVEGTFRSEREAGSADPDLLRLHSVSLNDLGDFFLRRGQPGDAEAALERYRQALDIDEQLHRANPNSAQAARDLSISLNKLGDLHLDRGQSGDAEAALERYRQSHDILEQLHRANPNSDHATRDLSVSLERLGDLLRSRGEPGDAEAALERYRQSLDIREQLHRANPNSAEAARDLSVSLEKLGDFLRGRGQPGDAEAALERYRQSLDIAEQLHRANPNSAEAARDLSVSLNKLGDFLWGRGQPGDAEAALERYRQSLDIAEQLHRANPNSAQASRDLVVSHVKLFHVFRDMERSAEAMEHLTQCFAILDSFHREGRPMDPQMRGLHAQLAPMFREQ